MISVHFMDGPLAGRVRTYERTSPPSEIHQPVSAGSPPVTFTHKYECVDETANGVYKARQTAMWVGEPHRPKEFGPTRRDLEDLTYEDDKEALASFMSELEELERRWCVERRCGYDEGVYWTRGLAESYGYDY